MDHFLKRFTDTFSFDRIFGHKLKKRLIRLKKFIDVPVHHVGMVRGAGTYTQTDDISTVCLKKLFLVSKTKHDRYFASLLLHMLLLIGES